MTLTQRRWSGLSLNWNYTFSRVMDDTAGTRSAYNWKTEKAVAAQDITHIMNGISVYQLPLGKGRQIDIGNPVLRFLASGWQISGITTFSTGQPLGPFTAPCNLPNAGSCYANYNRSFNGAARINGDYGSGDLLGTTPPSFIDRNAFDTPPAFTYGDTPEHFPMDCEGRTASTRTSACGARSLCIRTGGSRYKRMRSMLTT